MWESRGVMVWGLRVSGYMSLGVSGVWGLGGVKGLWV